MWNPFHLHLLKLVMNWSRCHFLFSLLELAQEHIRRLQLPLWWASGVSQWASLQAYLHLIYPLLYMNQHGGSDRIGLGPPHYTEGCLEEAEQLTHIANVVQLKPCKLCIIYDIFKAERTLPVYKMQSIILFILCRDVNS